MSDHREAGVLTVSPHEVARAKHTLGETGRLLERMDDALGTLVAIANILIKPGEEIALSTEQFEVAKRKPLRVQIEQANGRYLIRAKEETA